MFQRTIVEQRASSLRGMKYSSDEQIINLRELKKKNEVGEKKEIKLENIAQSAKESNEVAFEQNDSIEWQAEEYGYFAKSKYWLFVLAAFATLIEIYLLWTKSFFSFATFLLIFFVVFLYSVRKPRTLKFKIDFQGIKADGKIYKFDNFESFWIFYEPPGVKELFLKKKNAFSQSLSFPIDDKDPVVLREFLQKYLPEVEEEESLVDVLARRIGF